MINKESRIIVTGFNGQLGFDIVKKLLKEGMAILDRAVADYSEHRI